MPLDDNTAAPLGQSVNAGNEWFGLLAEAENHGLTTQTVAADIRGRAFDDLPALVAAALAAGPAPGMALDAIAPAFAPGDVIELRALDPAGGGAVALCGRLDDPAGRAALDGFIRAHIGLRNLYAGINPRRADMAGTTIAASASDVVARRAVVLDLDHKDAPSADPNWTRTVEALRAEVTPLLVLDSGNGVHVWLDVDAVQEPEVAASAASLATAMARLGADNMADPARIIRLPFTPNLPTASKRQRGAVVRLAAPVPGWNTLPKVMRAKPPRIGDLLSRLYDIAARLRLPGRGGAGSASVASSVGVGGSPKTGWAAPSADLLRMALDRLPNAPGGAFDAREDWLRVAHAVKGAAQEGGVEAEGREAFVEWSQAWGGDPDEPDRVWDGIAQPHTGWGTLMQTLERVNPAGAAEVKQATARAAFAVQAAANQAAITAAGLDPAPVTDPTKIPPRPHLYGKHVTAGFVSVLAAPGGQGKSALIVSEMIAMASGRELLEGERPVRPLRVWYHAAEDDLTEANRRLAASLIHFGLNHADLGGRLFVSSGRDGLRLQLARQGREGPQVVPGVVDGIANLAGKRKIDVIVFDPVAAMHGLPENDNTSMNTLLDALREIATRTGAAVVLLHHSSKGSAQDMDTAGAGAVRGASALVDGARSVRTLIRMTPKEAAKFGVAEEERRFLLRVEGVKQNLAPAADARWVRLVSVGLGNGAGLWPNGDHIGVAQRWAPPATQPGTASDLARVQAAISTSHIPYRADQRSPDWVGWLVANVMGLDAGGPGTKAEDRNPTQAANFVRVRTLVKGWLDAGGLVEQTEKDPASRKAVRTVVVGTPAVLAEDAPPEAGGEDRPGTNGAENAD